MKKPAFQAVNTSRIKKEREDCSEKKLLEYINANRQYPAEAKAFKIQGAVVVSFTVDEEGLISEPRLKRDIGRGCGEEALRIVNLMQAEGIRWIPAMAGGTPVPAHFNLVVRFEIPKNEEKLSRDKPEKSKEDREKRSRKNN